MIDHGAGQRRQATGAAGGKQSALPERRVHDACEIADPAAPISEIDIVSTRLRRRGGNPQILALKWTGRVNNQTDTKISEALRKVRLVEIKASRRRVAAKRIGKRPRTHAIPARNN